MSKQRKLWVFWWTVFVIGLFAFAYSEFMQLFIGSTMISNTIGVFSVLPIVSGLVSACVFGKSKNGELAEAARLHALCVQVGFKKSDDLDLSAKAKLIEQILADAQEEIGFASCDVRQVL